MGSSTKSCFYCIKGRELVPRLVNSGESRRLTSRFAEGEAPRPRVVHLLVEYLLLLPTVAASVQAHLEIANE